MSRASTSPDAWQPQTREDRDAILAELQAVLASPHFRASKRYPAFLQYVVENTLAGKSDLLKERTLGVEVFDRPPSYDTNADTVVRYTAGEVRKRLSLYYHELDHKPAIRIALPAGSYIPEFLHGHEDPDPPLDAANITTILGSHSFAHPATVEEPTPASLAALAGREPAPLDALARTTTPHPAHRWRWPATAALVLIFALGVAAWKFHAASPPQTPLDDFWSPLHDQRIVPICTGGVVFAPHNFSGVVTANKDIDYPFVSIQIASAIAQISALIGKNGAAAQLQSSPTTPLTELREHPVILLGGYNNQWTMRLLQPLRFHFDPQGVQAIIDQTHPGTRYERDPALPYSSADDYALIARFRDTTTDSWVIALAGLGRNGTEAAAHFATSPRYIQMLHDQLGSGFASRNLEVILKVNVVDGKTGAPTIIAIHTW